MFMRMNIRCTLAKDKDDVINNYFDKARLISETNLLHFI